jgi:hypothetical protein
MIGWAEEEQRQAQIGALQFLLFPGATLLGAARWFAALPHTFATNLPAVRNATLLTLDP